MKISTFKHFKIFFPYLGDIFLLTWLTGYFDTIVLWIIPLFLIDQAMGWIYNKKPNWYTHVWLTPFSFWSGLFIVMHITGIITCSWWWIVWFLFTDCNCFIPYLVEKGNEVRAKRNAEKLAKETKG